MGLFHCTLLLALAITTAAIGVLIMAYPPLCQAARPAVPSEGFPSAAATPAPPFPATWPADDSAPAPPAPVGWWFEGPGQGGTPTSWSTPSTPTDQERAITHTDGDGSSSLPEFLRWLTKPMVGFAMAVVILLQVTVIAIWIFYKSFCSDRGHHDL